MDHRSDGTGDRRTARAVAAIVLGCALLAACGTPVGVKRLDPTLVQRQLTRSILSSDQLSNSTRNSLFQHDLVTLWDDIKANKGRELCALEEAVQVAAMAVRYVLNMRTEP